MKMNAATLKCAVVDEPDPTESELESLAPVEFAVRDRSSAEWLVRKVVEADAHIERVKHQADCEVRRTLRERDFLLMRYGPQLERWTREQLEQTKGRRKSLLLLAGTVGFRSVGPKLVVDNAGLVLKWAKRHCSGAVIIVEKLSKRVLDDHFSGSGELPVGTHVEPARSKFYVK